MKLIIELDIEDNPTFMTAPTMARYVLGEGSGVDWFRYGVGDHVATIGRCAWEGEVEAS